MSHKSQNPFKLELIPIKEDDHAFLFRLYCSTREEEIRLTAWTDEEKIAFLEMQFKLQHHHYTTHYPDATFEKIVKNGQDAGRLYVDRWKDEIRIMDIALLPEFRGKGIGYYFMRQVMQEGREKGLPVRLHVERFNPALKFYKQLDFHIIEDKDVHLLLEWQPELNIEKRRRQA